MTVTPLGNTNQASGSTSIVITTTADSPAGATIVVIGGSGNGNLTFSSVTDSAGNTYTPGLAVGGGAVVTGRTFYSQNALHLPSGGTITVTDSSITGAKTVQALSIANALASSFDVEGAGNSNASGTTPSTASGALATVGELLIGWVFIGSGAADSFTEGAGFTTLASLLFSATLRVAYEVAPSTSSVTYAPVLGTARQYASNVIAFKTLPPPPASPFSRQQYLHS